MSTLTINNPEACGLGEGERCCAFLTFGGEWTCGRTVPGVYETILARLAAGTMNAKGDPGTAPYPECQAKR